MTAATTPKLPSLATPAQVKFYHDEGYVLIPNLIPKADLDPIQAQLFEFEAGNRGDWSEDHFQVADPARVRDPKGGKLIFGVQTPSRTSEIFRKVADHPKLQAAMGDLLGGPVARFTDQCAIKSKYITTPQGGCTFFHQDCYYWHIDPSLGANCWIPLQDVGKDAIALAVMPRSHAGWKLQNHEQYYDDPAFYGGRATQPYQRHRIPLDTIDFSKEILVPMKAGDALFFTNYTWHRSEKNLSGKSLTFYAIAYKRSDA